MSIRGIAGARRPGRHETTQSDRSSPALVGRGWRRCNETEWQAGTLDSRPRRVVRSVSPARRRRLLLARRRHDPLQTHVRDEIAVVLPAVAGHQRKHGQLRQLLVSEPFHRLPPAGIRRAWQAPPHRTRAILSMRRRGPSWSSSSRAPARSAGPSYGIDVGLPGGDPAEEHVRVGNVTEHPRKAPHLRRRFEAIHIIGAPSRPSA